MSTNNARSPLLLCFFMAFSCAEKPVPTDNAIVVRHSPLSEAACTPTDAAMVRISTERLIVQRSDQDGVWTTIATADGPFEGPNTLRLEGIKSGPLKMRVIGCQGGQVSRVGYYNGQLSEYAKQRIAVELRPTETFSCGGETLRLATDDSTGLSMPSLFSASVPLDDNLLLIAGGAHRDIPSESVFVSDLGASSWTIFDRTDGYLFAGRRRHENYSSRPMVAARIGAAAVPIHTDTRRGALVVGGAEAVRRSVNRPDSKLGPFEIGYLNENIFKSGCRPMQARAEFFDSDVGGMAPVANQNQFGQRSFAGFDSDDRTTVIVGGLECGQGGVAASQLVEIVTDGNIERLELPTPLLGPTVTSIGNGQYVVWGFPIGNCEYGPGWLITTTGPPAAFPLDIPDAPDRCSPKIDECQAWLPTAFHSATRLPNGPGGESRILIIGGLSGDETALVNTPKLSGACAGNRFVLSVQAQRASISVIPSNILDVSVERAFHQATRLDSTRVLVTGGWVVAEPSTRPCTAPQDCGGSICFEGFCRTAMPAPGAFYASNQWFIYDDTQGRFVQSGFLAAPRFGHLAIKTIDGQVVLLGGVSSPMDGFGEFELTESLETYAPRPLEPVCNQNQ